MSGSQTTETVRQVPSGATSITTATAIVVVLNYAVKLRYGTDIPADVGMAIGVILAGMAHLAQVGFFWWTDAREQPRPLLPPASQKP